MADPVLKHGDKSPSVSEAQNLLNRNGAILDPDGDFGPGTEIAVHEFQAAANPPLPVTGVIDAGTWVALRALPEPSPDIPTRAVAFICREEVGGRELYDRTGLRPTWPGSESGVTIGVGYDLGQQAAFGADWSDFLPPAQMALLKPWIGVKGARAQAAPQTLTGITIPWHVAWMVFIRRTLPQEITSTRNAFTGWNAMPRLCLGVLVSLVYNRGPSMKLEDDSRREMREIRDAVAQGRFGDVPAALRSMQRLWPVGNGLRDRREREAKLFEEGLKG